MRGQSYECRHTDCSDCPGYYDHGEECFCGCHENDVNDEFGRRVMIEQVGKRYVATRTHATLNKQQTAYAYDLDRLQCRVETGEANWTND